MSTGDAQAAKPEAQRLNESPEHVGDGDDPHQPVPFHHRQAPDFLLLHDQSGLLQGLVGPHGDHRLGHHLLHRELGEEVVHLPDGKGGGLGGHGVLEVLVGDQAQELPVLDHREAAELLLPQKVYGFQHRGIRGDGEGVLGHPVPDQHGSPPAPVYPGFL
jgi:hypothetical protein